MNEIILRINDISKSFFALQALKNVSFNIHEGEVVGLIGANGAGKSTLLKIIGGVLSADSGELVLEGQPFETKTPRDALRHGIVSVYQEINLFQNMTVAENLFIGREIRLASGVIDWKNTNRKAQEVLDELGLPIQAETQVSRLSVAQQQLIEIARAVTENPKILILDEPTAALSEEQIQWLFGRVRRLVENGTTIIYVSHRLDEVTELCDRCVVLRDGEKVAELEDRFEKKALILHMVGHEVNLDRVTWDAPSGDTILECRNISTRHGVNDISFSLHNGEILGVAGLVGAGRTELLQAVYGVDRMSHGEIYLHGKHANIRSPKSAIEHGIALVSEDRKQEGLFLTEKVRFNIAAATMRRKERASFGMINQMAEEAAAKAAARSVMLDDTRMEHLARTLSGGNQQKVVLAKNMLIGSGILLLDEPTRGVDVGAREEIYQIIRGLAQAGKAILLVSSDWEELMGLCNRVIVIAEGRLTGELNGDDINQANMLELSTIAHVKKVAAGQHRHSLLRSKFTKNNMLLLLGMMLAMYIFGFFTLPFFRSWNNIQNIVGQSMLYSLLTVGSLVVIITGGIDLSIGTTFALVSVIGARFYISNPDSILAGILIMFGVGMLVGLVNATLAVFARVDSFVATLGTGTILQGLALIVSRRPIGPVPRFFRMTFAGSLFGLPKSFFIIALVLVVFGVLLHYTILGRRFYAVGENATNSFWTGIPVKSTRYISFLICSGMAVVAAIFMMGRTGAADAALGPGLELDAIAGSLIGGATLAGGKGSVVCSILAALMLTMLVNILNHLDVGMYFQNVVRGILMLGIIISHEHKQTREREMVQA